MSPGPPAKASLRRAILGLFPWLGWFGLSPTKALKIKSAAGRTEIEGGGSPAIAARDTGGRLYVDSVTGLLWYAPGPSPTPYALVAGGAGPPLPTDPGTRVVLGPGSGKVTIG